MPAWRLQTGHCGRSCSRQKPKSYRNGCRTEEGTDTEGRDQFGKPKEIGTIWPRKGNNGGGLLAFDIMPIELTQRQSMIFILPVGDSQTELPY